MASASPGMPHFPAFWAPCLFLLWISSFHRPANALYQEDAGRLDFFVATSGHGPVEWIHTVENDGTDAASGIVITAAPSSSCYVAARTVGNGTLLWRRSVCSSNSDGTSPPQDSSSSPSPPRVTLLSSPAGSNPSLIHSLETSTGVLRTWVAASGALVWETTVLKDAIGNGKVTTGLWIHAARGDPPSYYLATPTASWEAATGAAAPDLVRSAQASKPKQPHQKDLPALTSAVFAEAAHLQIRIEDASRATLTWRSDPSVDFDSLPLIDAEAEEDDALARLALLSCSEHHVWALVASERGTTYVVAWALSGGSQGHYRARIAWKAHEGLGGAQAALLLDSSHYVGDLDAARSRELLDVRRRWQAQWRQLVGAISSVVRVSSPASANDQASTRNHLFGFVKTAVLLSAPSASRVFGVDTIGSQRGLVRYALDLPRDGWAHRMMHGGAPVVTTSGGGGGSVGASSPTGAAVPHHRDVLVVSTRGRAVHWLCFDGATGVVHQRGESAALLSSPVVQMVPTAGVWPCRQSALLLLQDGSTVVVPPTPTTLEAVNRQLQQASNGFYVHSIQYNRGVATLSSLHVSSPPSHYGFPTHPIGSTNFPGEDIVRVAYPRRDEAVESPSLALGDDSLLLKYINPHLVVILTMKHSGSNDTSNNALVEALQKSKSKDSGVKTPKRKPTGVSDSSAAADSSPSKASNVNDTPNFFVNLVDAVSGRLLYRISHSHALSHPTPTALVSENWIFYSFANEKTRRAEVGVLSLYEGMIDSAGLTAFASPELSTTFSSLNARDSKPVVLAKTYSLARPVTALGMTSTRSGISSRRLVLAGVDGRVYTIERKVLEPRRPVGPLKDSEKKEGLAQYSEYIPFVPYSTLSYNLTVEGVQRILTAPTDLESQTLILAYGGPDVFFARTSPSRGFDLLPDSFNRVLLLMVVFALMAVTVVLRQRVSKKFQKQAWL